MIEKVKKELDSGKKNNFDRDICPELTTLGPRCKDCCFWQKMKKIEFISVEKAKKLYDVKAKEEDRLYVIEYQGCALLDEVCPHCIIDKEKIAKFHLIPLSGGEFNKHISVEPAKLHYIQKKKEFYCDLCKKTIKHKDVRHTINLDLLRRIEHPEWFKDGKN